MLLVVAILSAVLGALAAVIVLRARGAARARRWLDAHLVVDLLPVVEAALEAVRPAAAARGVRLAAVLVPQAGAVAGDARGLEQAVSTLLENAVRYTERGGRVEVRLEREEDAVALRVKDTGEGIAPERLARLFERPRPERDPEAAARAAGSGLVRVRHVVEAHGGSVAAESAGPGRGSTFTVRLPVARRPRRLAGPARRPPRAAAAEQCAVSRGAGPGAGAGRLDR